MSPGILNNPAARRMRRKGSIASNVMTPMRAATSVKQFAKNALKLAQSAPQLAAKQEQLNGIGHRLKSCGIVVNSVSREKRECR